MRSTVIVIRDVVTSAHRTHNSSISCLVIPFFLWFHCYSIQCEWCDGEFKFSSENSLSWKRLRHQAKCREMRGGGVWEMRMSVRTRLSCLGIAKNTFIVTAIVHHYLFFKIQILCRFNRKMSFSHRNRHILLCNFLFSSFLYVGPLSSDWPSFTLCMRMSAYSFQCFSLRLILFPCDPHFLFVQSFYVCLLYFICLMPTHCLL